MQGLGKLNFILLIFAAFFKPDIALAFETLTQNSAPFYAKKNSKVTQVGTIPIAETVEITGSLIAKKWYPVIWKNKAGWVDAKNLAIGKKDKRGLSSIEPANLSSNPFSVGADLGVHTQSYGVGLGVNANCLLPVEVPRPWTVGASLAFRYFPSVVYSAKVYEVSASGRGLYRFHRKMSVGGDLGIVYIHASLPAVDAAYASYFGAELDTSFTSVGVIFGGMFSYDFTEKLSAIGSPRILLFSDMAILVTAGIEYRF